MIVDMDALDRVIERAWLRNTDDLAFPDASALLPFDLEEFARDIYRMGFLAALSLIEERATRLRAASLRGPGHVSTGASEVGGIAHRPGGAVTPPT